MSIKNSEYLSKFTGAEIDAAIEHMRSVEVELEEKVDKTQTINGHALEGDITLTAQDVGAVGIDAIGDGTIVITQGDIPRGTITANQTENAVIELSNANNSAITFLQGDVPKGTITTNQTYNSDISFDAVNDSTITFMQGGSVIGTITTNQTEDVTISFEKGSDVVALGGLEDVEINSVTNGQALVYNSSDQKWKNGNSTSVVFVDWSVGEDTNVIFIEDPLIGNNQFKQFAFSGDTSWVLLKDGSLYGCGCNESGQQGSGDVEDVDSYIQRLSHVDKVCANNKVTWAIKDDDTLWGCGENFYRQQGSGGNSANVLTFTQRLTDVKQVVLSDKFTYVLKNDGTIYGSGTYTSVSTYSTSYNISTNTYSSFVSLSNEYSGGVSNHSSKLYVMDECLYSVETDGHLRIRGYSPCGALGLGNYINGITSMDTDTQYTEYFEDALVGVVVKDIYLAHGLVWVLSEDGKAYRAGNNVNDNLASSEAVLRSFVLLEDANINSIKKIACSEKITFLLTTNGMVYSCGSNDYKQLGNGSSSGFQNSFGEVLTLVDRTEQYFSVNHVARDISCSNNCAWVLTTDNELYSCGYNECGNFGQGGFGDTRGYFEKRIDNVKSFYADDYVTWVLKNDGTLWGCGYNEFGNQGSGDTINVDLFIKRLEDVESFNCSKEFTQAVKTDGTLWMCGRNNYGQQGSGNTNNVLEFIQRVQPTE